MKTVFVSLACRLSVSFVVAAVIGGAACTDRTLSNVRVEAWFRDSVHAPTDTLYGTFKFINTGPSSVRHSFASGYQYGIWLYEQNGERRLIGTNEGAMFLSVTYLELEPHATRTDTITAYLWDPERPLLAAGRYRIRAALADHDEYVYDETEIVIK